LTKVTILSRIRRLVFSYVYAQVIVIIGLTLLLYSFYRSHVAFSFLFGGIICILPNAYFAHKLFAKTGAQVVRSIIASFYICEVVKYVITGLLFVIAFKYLNTNKLALFVGYIVAQLTFWITALSSHQTVNKL
jgi:ATP synthase protein I